MRFLISLAFVTHIKHIPNNLRLSHLNKHMASKSETCCPVTAWPALETPEGYEPKGTEDKLEGT